MKRWSPVAVVFAFLLFVSSASADTQSVDISASVPSIDPPGPTLPTVQFTGLAAPGARVAISRDGSSLVVNTANSQGIFSFTLVDQPVGQHEYDITAEDTNGEALASQTFIFNLQDGGSTTVSGIFLGPSITLDQTEIDLGESVTVTGTTIPNADVTIVFTAGSSTQIEVQSAENGRWTRTLSTDELLGAGQYAVRARAVSSEEVVSAYSNSLNFLVNPADPFSFCVTADINCDRSVNLIDFSIMLFFWRQENPQNPRADINRDGIVDIVDFSIMLFQWTG